MHLKRDPSIKLNRNAIQIKSKDRMNILLPYYGEVPRCRSEPVEAGLSVIVQPEAFTWPYPPVRILLIAKTPSGTEKFPVSAEDDEVEEMLRQLFADPNNGKSGLDPYWEGHWETMFMVWRHERQRRNAMKSA